MRLLCVVFLLCVFGSVFSQGAVIRGQILDGHSREPIPFANVFIKGTTRGVSANVEGFFNINVRSFQDTLASSSVGHKTIFIPLQKNKVSGYVFRMARAEISLREIIVKPGENPAHVILRNLLKKKDSYNQKKIPLWQSGVYNKVEIDLENLDFNKEKSLGLFSFILDNIDSSSDEKPFLPVFLSESISEVYYQSNPKKEKEIIKASKLSGVKDKNMTKFLGGMYQKVNVMDNWVEVLEVPFVSPFSNNGLAYYKYYLTDSVWVDSQWVFKISFQPKRKQENTFNGDFWIDKTHYLIRELSMSLSEGVNLNFVDRLSITQSYQAVNDTLCFLSKDRLMIDFKSAKEGVGIIGRRTTSYENVIIGDLAIQKYFVAGEDVLIDQEAFEKDNQYWRENRHENLSKNELGIYEMVDSLKNLPQFNTILDILTTVITGYQKFGPIDLGPYFSAISSDQIEGARIRLGFRTNKDFSKLIRIHAYGAYGFLDKKWKYAGGISYTPQTFLWQTFALDYKNDFNLESLHLDEIDQDNLFALAFRKPIRQRLVMNEAFTGSYNLELFRGFSSKIIIKEEHIQPAFDFAYFMDESLQRKINNTSIGLRLRWNYKEEIIEGAYDRISLGSDYPTFIVDYEKGLGDILRGDFNYHKMILIITDDMLINPFGRLYYSFRAGNSIGEMPYLLRYCPKSNDTYYYTWRAFNNMLPYEFAFKEFLELQMFHHFQGLLLNRIPLMRRLKWRSLLCAKAITGQSAPDESGQIREVNWDKPYIEVGAGVENIFKVFRIDAVWRLNHTNTNNPEDYIQVFGLYGSLQLQF